jgi:hypothetical protein
MSHSSAATASRPSPARPSKGAGSSKAVWALVVGGAALLILVVSIAFLGAVSGEQFSPNTFRRRTFVYYEIPLLRLQVTPVKRMEISDDLRRHLAAKGYVPSGKAPQWEVVQQHRRLGGASPAGAAQILCDYLNQFSDTGGQVWLDWSKKHPALADILWPEIVTAANQRLYWFMPDMFALARDTEDSKKFKSDLRHLLADKYTAAADIQRKLGRLREAARLYKEALLREPTHAAAKQGLAESGKGNS